MGFASGVVALHGPEFLGALAPSSNAAELMAATAAAAWAKDAPWEGVPVTLFPDNSLAIGILLGSCSTSEFGLQPGILQARSSELSAVRPFAVQHVHAHQGAPWNELADSMAKLAPTRAWIPPYAAKIAPEGVANVSARRLSFLFYAGESRRLQ